VPGISSLCDEFEKRPSPVDTIPPQSKKRKAAEEIVSSDNLSAARSNKRIASEIKEGPPTPLTTASPMDSEDDFMSGMSSEDDVLQESDNDDGSADGMFAPGISLKAPFRTPFADALDFQQISDLTSPSRI